MRFDTYKAGHFDGFASSFWCVKEAVEKLCGLNSITFAPNDICKRL